MSRETRYAIELEDGQTMAEYTLVLAVIVIAVVATLGTLGSAVDGLVAQVVGLFS